MVKEYYYRKPTKEELSLMKNPYYVYKNLELLWNGVYSNENEYQLKKEKIFNSLLNKYMSYFNKHNINSIIDIGGGRGRFAIEFAKHNFNTSLQDISNIALEHAKKIINREKVRINIVKKEVAYEGLDKIYEGMVVNRVLHNIEPVSRKLFLMNLKKHLASNGKIIISASSDKVENVFPFCEYGVNHPLENETSVICIVDKETNCVFPYIRKFYTPKLLVSELSPYFRIEKIDCFNENPGNLKSKQKLSYLVAYMGHNEK